VRVLRGGAGRGDDTQHRGDPVLHEHSQVRGVRSGYPRPQPAQRAREPGHTRARREPGLRPLADRGAREPRDIAASSHARALGPVAAFGASKPAHAAFAGQPDRGHLCACRAFEPRNARPDEQQHFRSVSAVGLDKAQVAVARGEPGDRLRADPGIDAEHHRPRLRAAVRRRRIRHAHRDRRARVRGGAPARDEHLRPADHRAGRVPGPVARALQRKDGGVDVLRHLSAEILREPRKSGVQREPDRRSGRASGAYKAPVVEGRLQPGRRSDAAQGAGEPRLPEHRLLPRRGFLPARGSCEPGVSRRRKLPGSRFDAACGACEPVQSELEKLPRGGCLPACEPDEPEGSDSGGLPHFRLFAACGHLSESGGKGFRNYACGEQRNLACGERHNLDVSGSHVRKARAQDAEQAGGEYRSLRVDRRHGARLQQLGLSRRRDSGGGEDSRPGRPEIFSEPRKARHRLQRSLRPRPAFGAQ